MYQFLLAENLPNMNRRSMHQLGQSGSGGHVDAPPPSFAQNSAVQSGVICCVGASFAMVMIAAVCGLNTAMFCICW